MTGREVLTGSAFSLTGGNDERGFGAVWGLGAMTGFEGREGGLEVDGEVTTGMLGSDWSSARATVGVAVGHSRGAGSYRAAAGGGDVESMLTGVYPYGRYEVNPRLAIWGVGGYGEGTLTLTPDGESSMETDTRLAMGAAGVRGVLAEAPAEGGVELAAKTDAMAVRMSSGATRGLAASEADVTRVRLALEGTWRGLEAGGGTLTPSMELGVRHDGGDAETGLGADIGAWLLWSAPARGISAKIWASGLLTHEAEGFRERGLVGSLAWDPTPASERGVSFALTQTMGAQDSGGTDALFSQRHLGGLVANENGSDVSERRQLEVRLGYGFGLFGDRYTGTPEVGFGLSEAHRETVLGWRLAEVPRAGLVFELGIEGARREPVGGGSGAERRLVVSLGWRLGHVRRQDVDFEIGLEATHREVANDNREAEQGIGLRLIWRW